MEKVIDMIHPRAPDEIYAVSHTISIECYNNGNDSYYPFSIVDNPSGEEEGAGYVSDAEIVLLTNWLIKQGAEVGETVLVKHWW